MDEGSVLSDSAVDPSGVTVVTSEPHADADRSGEFEPGDRVGRYVLLRPIGSGGMGVVFEARDPDLDRAVAVKVLRDTRFESAQARLLREAQALARLTHENVVEVFDVGVHDHQVFVAMAFIQGRDLKAWLTEKPRSTAQIVDAFARAGAGLVAAHAMGIVHRDFKPDNVLVGDDGRVLVTDFGLARGLPLTPSTSTVDGSGDGLLAQQSTDAVDVELTRAGMVMGTPAYMAPEQHRGRQTDPRTDQYAFCVALFEALAGVRPFVGKTPRELLRAKAEGAPPWPPETSGVPTRIKSAVERGLRSDPDGRWPSMDALLEQLAAPANSRHGWRVLFGAAVVAAGILVLSTRGEETGRSCDPGERLEATWNPERRGAARVVFENSVAPYATTAWRRTEPLLDAYARRWGESYRAACDAATQVALDRRMQCLTNRLHALDSLVTLLAAADASVIEHAVSAAARLPSVDGCDADARADDEPMPDDGALAQRVTAIRHRLVRAKVWEDASQYAEALAEAEAAHAQAETLAWAPLLAETRTAIGSALERSGDYDRSARELERACLDGSAAGHDVAAADAGTELVFVLGFHKQDLDGAGRWARHTEVILDRMGEDPLARARLHNAMGTVLSGLGDAAGAAERFEGALVQFEQGLGARHPDVGTARHNLSVTQMALGRYEEAEASVKTALAIYVESLGPDHPDTANALDHLGSILQRQGRLDEAAEVTKQSLDVRLAVLGAEHPDVGRSYNNLGSMYEAMGDHDRALSHYRRAADSFAEHLGESSTVTAAARINVAASMVHATQYAQARSTFLASLATLEADLPRNHPYFAHAFVGLSAAENGLGHPKEALRWSDRALQMCEGVSLEPALCAMARFSHARGRHTLGHPAEAIATATAALEQLREATGTDTTESKEIAAWIAERNGEASD